MSASNANAIDPSSKPSNEAGGRESRFEGGGGLSEPGRTDPPRPGGGMLGGRALASAAAPVPFEGGCECGGSLANDIVDRRTCVDDADGGGTASGCDDGAGGGTPATRPGSAACICAVFVLAAAGRGGGAFGGDGASGRTAGIRVESMRTAAISVEPSVDIE
jgi:hypothetical protein